MGKSLNPNLSNPGSFIRNTGLGSLALVVLMLVASPSAQAASKTWDGGCGVDTSWSCANNWSDNAVPGAEDTVTFNAISTHNATVDPGFAGTVAILNVNTGYTGTISLGRSLTVSKAFTQKTGSFDAGGQGLTLKSLTLSGGAFRASSGTTSISGTFKVSGTPTFIANGGTVDFDGGPGTLTCGGVVFNHVDISHTAGTKTVGSSCNLPLGNDPSAAGGGSIKLNGMLSGTGALTASGTFTLGATGGLSGFSGLTAGALVVNGAYDFGAYSPFSVAQNFTLASGASFVAPSATASFAGNFTISEGAEFDANGGTVIFNGTASRTLSCGNKVFSLVKFEHTAGGKTVGANCSLPLGNDPDLGNAIGASVRLNGSLSGTGTLTAYQTFTLSSTASLSGFSGLVTESGFNMTGVSADFSSYGTFSIGNYTQTGGTISVPNGASVSGRFTLNSGATFNAAETGSVSFGNNFMVNSGATFNAKKSTVVFDGGFSASINCGSTVFNSVVFSNVAGTKVVGSSCNLPLGSSPTAGSGGSITLNGTLSGSGTLTASGALNLASSGELSGFSGLKAAGLTVSGTHSFGSYSPFTVKNDFTLKAAAHFTAPSGVASFGGGFASEVGAIFMANGGTVELVGTEQTVTGDTTFNNLSKRVSSADTLTFNAGDIQTVQGALTLEGKDASNQLALASSIPGVPWLIDDKGTAEVHFVSVSDSTNTGASIIANESTDGGGNTGWIFPGPASEFVVSAATTTPTAGEADNLTITAKDAQGNTATSYTGSHSLTFGPVADSPSGSHATVTNSSGTATNFATATAITFTEGVATVTSGKNGQMVLVKAGSTSLTVTDGSITNGSGLAITVSPGTATELVLGAATTTPTAGATDNLTITARDAQGNTAT
ncbi:MAG TPA: hypothetical protein VFJ64_03775, partial [Solirubrobacterales bacterium]|nr:hypothetical protein [Solirubrobacterales bacterium]